MRAPQIYYFAEPSNVRWMIGAALLLVVLAVIFYLKHDSVIGTYGYKKPVPTQKDPTAEELLLGGNA